MSRRLKIGILGSKGTTLDLIEGLADDPNLEIAAVFVLNEGTAARNQVAFFEAETIRDTCERRGIPVVTLESYTLKAEADVAAIAAADLDILCVLGWERLLPDHILALPRHFACGMHGSPYGLPRGRGRSPMNWAIITGHRHFTTSLFRYSAGVDDGDVIAARTFEINEHDTIQTLHQKNRWVMQSLLSQAARDILDDCLSLTPQPRTEPSFYPRRRPEDGAIDWRQPTAAIHRLVRAVAPPYPGARSRLGEDVLTIEAAQPYDQALFAASIAPGTIVDVSLAAGSFVVKTLDGSLLVTRSSGAPLTALAVGLILDSADRRSGAATLAERYGEHVPEDQWEISAEWFR